MPFLQSRAIIAVPVPLVLAAVLLTLGTTPAGSQVTPSRAGAGTALRPDAVPAPEPAPADTTVPEELVAPYETVLNETGNAALDTALRGVSALLRLQQSAPTTPEGLVARALGDREQLVRALRSEGYYAGVPVVRLNGEPADAQGLALRLVPLVGPGRPPIRAEIGAEPNQRYVIGSVRVSPELPEADIASAGAVTGLDPGDPARSAEVIAAGDRLVEGMRRAGRPFAAVARREAVVDHDTRTLEVDFVLAPGPRARFAAPTVEGTDTVDQRLLDRVAGQLENRDYSPDTQDRVRRDLLGLGVFGTVRARAAERLDADGRLPVAFTVIDRPRRAVGGTVAYETRYGFTGTAYWEHRNLFGAAERLRLEATVGRLGGGEVSDVNGRIAANFRKPWIFGRNMTLVSELALLRERLDAYDRDGGTAAVGIETKPDPRLTLGVSAVADISRVTEFDLPDDRRYSVKLFGALGTAVFDNTDSLLDPSRGYRINGLVQPLFSFSEDSGYFTRLRVGGSAYFDFTNGDRGSVLAVRGLVGAIPGGNLGVVPPHYRFFAGGGGSVRGYDYQSIGPRRADNSPRGGLSLVEAGIELRQRVSGPWGVALFLDAGTAGADVSPDFGSMKLGAGAGVRYATPIGPIRADVGIPLSNVPGSSGYGLYVGIGQAF